MSSGSQDPNWKSWIIASAAPLCALTLTLLFSYYKILRLLCRRLESAGFSRNPNQSRVLSEFNLDDPLLQFQRNGLDFSIARSLPVTQFKKKDEAEAAERSPSQSNTDCAICLGEFEDGEWLKELPKCSHEFHISCIDTWFVSHSNCPTCRSQVYDLMRDPPVPTQTPEETLSRDEVEETAVHFKLLRSAIIDVIHHRGDLMTCSKICSLICFPNQKMRETMNCIDAQDKAVESKPGKVFRIRETMTCIYTTQPLP